MCGVSTESLYRLCPHSVDSVLSVLSLGLLLATILPWTPCLLLDQHSTATQRKKRSCLPSTRLMTNAPRKELVPYAAYAAQDQHQRDSKGGETGEGARAAADGARGEAHCLPKQNNSRNMIMMHPTTKSSEIQGSLYWMPLVDMIAAWRASCTAMAPCKASNSISSSACCGLILLGEPRARGRLASRVKGEKKPTIRSDQVIRK